MTIKKLDKEALDAVALSVRTLSMDGVQKANSGHPGLPLGCAELGALLYGEILKHYPGNPGWQNRDRFVLSAGHGSMFLYSLLHLTGYGLSLSDLQNFRQLDSRTPGHPEYRDTPGVETTTGPLGQGFANAVGIAMAERMLAARFNTPDFDLINHFTYVLAGDGDLMEGVTHEAASLAGHLGLGKLIVFYDSNKITIEGSTDLTFSDDVLKRFESFHWHTAECDGYDYPRILELVNTAQGIPDKPSLILLHTRIGKGAATKAGSHKVHGSPLGEEEIRATRRALNLPEEAAFYIDPAATSYFTSRQKDWERDFKDWEALFTAWGEKHPELLRKWNSFFNTNPPEYKGSFSLFKEGDKLATRAASGKVLNAIAGDLENLIGGSADLAPSNNTHLDAFEHFQKETPGGRNLHFGIREHAMGSIMNGMALCGAIRPFGATFLVFADYMRPAIRLAALMKLPVIYIFTHDSIFVGEDGPTHQPIEQVASLRIIPGLMVLRPADAQETELAWEMAINNTGGPSALILTRQGLEVFPKAEPAWQDKIKSGAYIAQDSEGEPDVVVIATGSEVTLALEACRELGSQRTRVVSMISPGLFQSQPLSRREFLIPPGAEILVIEAGISFGWQGIAGRPASVIAIDRFGKSGPGSKVAENLGLSLSRVKSELEKLLG